MSSNHNTSTVTTRYRHHSLYLTPSTIQYLSQHGSELPPCPDLYNGKMVFMLRRHNALQVYTSDLYLPPIYRSSSDWIKSLRPGLSPRVRTNIERLIDYTVSLQLPIPTVNPDILILTNKEAFEIDIQSHRNKHTYFMQHYATFI